MYRLLMTGFLLLAVSRSPVALEPDPPGPSTDQNYFDFWVGTWYRVIGGRIDTTSPRFQVERGVHRTAFEESWRLVIDSVTTLNAGAFRAWDQTMQRWRYVWISSDGRFQVWDGRKVGDDWYIYREFEVEGSRFLSRQAWLPVEPGRVVRVTERSKDGDRSWQLRFREEYVRLEG